MCRWLPSKRLIQQMAGKVRHIHNVRSTVPTIGTKMNLPVGDDVVASAIDGIATGIAHPFPGPPSVDHDAPLAAVLETRRERRLVHVAVKCPAVRQRVHLFARRAPMKVA